jgi:hypothetical protein
MLVIAARKTASSVLGRHREVIRNDDNIVYTKLIIERQDYG